tara:strand:+ start:79 stop:411 length:333 start_codon:yes stop_codon:yes gene_type:complete
MKLSLITDIHCLQKPLAYYRWHPENMSSKKEDLRIKELKNWKRRNFKEFKNFKNFKSFDENIIYSSLLDKIRKNKKINLLNIFRVRISQILKLFFHFFIPKVIKNKILIK